MQLENLASPFVVQGYDEFEGAFYNIYPVESHTHDSFEVALSDAEVVWRAIQATQPSHSAGEIQDSVFIVDLMGVKVKYPLEENPS